MLTPAPRDRSSAPSERAPTTQRRLGGVGAIGHDSELRAEYVAQRALKAAGLVGSNSAIAANGSGPGIPLSLAPSIVRRVLARQAHPLEPAIRARLEAGFEQELDDVRIHFDEDAARSARALRANAFAVGNHIIFGRGQFAPGTDQGRRLLAHEVAHVQEQTSMGGRALIQRDASPEQEFWLPELEQILPPHVGALAAMIRVSMLVDIFGAKGLEQHVLAINSDRDAKTFTQTNGVPAVVALFDTSQGGRFDVPAARRALTEHRNLYSLSTLDHATRQVPAEAPRSFLFESPGQQRLPEPREGEFPVSSSEERKVVFVEPDLSRAGSVFVSFAYPRPDVGSERIRTAKNQILTAIARVIRDLGSLPPAASREERREQSSVRARLSEPWSMFTRTTPLRVYIASDPEREMATGQVAAFTDRVYVNLGDVGNEGRLQAAVRIPLILLRGGPLPASGRVVDVPPATEAELQRIVLHESLHVLLIRLSADAEAVWRANSNRLALRGNAYPAARFAELVRKYLIAQEEVFAYENEASLYPPVSTNKGEYDSFIRNVELFLQRRGLTLTALPRAIPVHTLVDRRAVTWTVPYKVPAGAIDVTLADQEVVDLLLSAYPLR